MIDKPLTPEQCELVRALIAHPDVLRAVIETNDGRTLHVKYPPEGGERQCYEIIEL